MRNIKNHTRASVIRAKFSKVVGGNCKLFTALQRKFAECLDKDESVETFEANVVVDQLPIEGVYTTDFVVKYKDGTAMAWETVLRRHITKPQTMKLLSLSRAYWLHRGVKWGIVTEAE